MATSTPPSPPPPPSYLDLSLNLNHYPPPKPPKQEPIHIPLSPSPPLPPVTPSIPLQALAPLRALPPTQNLDEEALFAEYYRLASSYFSSTPSSSNSQAIIPLPPPSNPDSYSIAPQPIVKKRKPRSSDMVRVSSLTIRDQIYFRDMVRRARITFESLRTQITHNQLKAEALGLMDRTRNPRPDMRASALMADRELWLNRDKRIIGSIPGISVGDAFLYRMELCVVGLHGQTQAGIDYVTASKSASGEPVATSIIVSGGYEDDEDKGDILIYTGHGGRDPILGKHCMDQKLEGGNLALERSMAYSIEIRVIRGVPSKKAPVGKVYLYDGLYKVIEYWLDRGKAGFGVYKFKLMRLKNQEQMGSVNYKMAENLKFEPLRIRPIGYLTWDLAVGRENFPVLLFNDIDEDRDPMLFEYLNRPIFPSLARSKLAIQGGGCECNSNCSYGCNCMDRNGGEFPYDNNGTLLKGKPIIYECGPYCNCPMSCPNRVSQKGIRARLEVFRSRETGWGVRSLDLIKAGTFICEFSGTILTKQELEMINNNSNGEMCLVYPNKIPNRWIEWGDISDVISDATPTPDFPKRPENDFAIDVSTKRNVACYLSHSCSPNVFLQYVLFDHYDKRYPHVMIFAMENIPPLRELSVDYGVVEVEEEFVGKLTNG